VNETEGTARGSESTLPRDLPEQEDQARLSIVVVTRNTLDLTIACLDSLAECMLSGKCEVVVVDNASTDGTGIAIAQRYPKVEVLRESHNVGFARASNDGARKASGAVLLFLNSDTVASLSAIEGLAAGLRANPALGALCPQLIYPDGRRQLSASFVPTPATELCAWARRRARSGVAAAAARGDNLAGLGFLTGAAVAVRREAFDAVGGFDESLFFYREIVDLCARIAARGWELRVAPRVTIVHLGGGSTNRVLGEIELTRSQHQYFRKHYGTGAAVLVTSVAFLARLRRALFDTLATLLTVGCWARVRRRAYLHWRLCLWHLLLMPQREARIYRTLFGDWQT